MAKRKAAGSARGKARKGAKTSRKRTIARKPTARRAGAKKTGARKKTAAEKLEVVAKETVRVEAHEHLAGSRSSRIGPGIVSAGLPKIILLSLRNLKNPLIAASFRFRVMAAALRIPRTFINSTMSMRAILLPRS